MGIFPWQMPYFCLQHHLIHYPDLHNFLFFLDLFSFLGYNPILMKYIQQF